MLRQLYKTSCMESMFDLASKRYFTKLPKKTAILKSTLNYNIFNQTYNKLKACDNKIL